MTRVHSPYHHSPFAYPNFCSFLFHHSSHSTKIVHFISDLHTLTSRHLTHFIPTIKLNAFLISSKLPSQNPISQNTKPNCFFLNFQPNFCAYQISRSFQFCYFRSTQRISTSHLPNFSFQNLHTHTKYSAYYHQPI